MSDVEWFGCGRGVGFLGRSYLVVWREVFLCVDSFNSNGELRVFFISIFLDILEIG